MIQKYKKFKYLKPLEKKRLKSVYLLSLLIIFCLLGRVVNLQAFNSSGLEEKARAIQIKITDSLNTRRSIVDRKNRLIAYDKSFYKLWAHPRYFNFPGDSFNKIRPIEEVAEKLSPVIGIDKETIISKFSDRKSGIELFDELTEEQAKGVQSLQISGLDLEIYSKRIYPQGDLYSNLVGFVNDENKGSAGLELHLDNQIRILNRSKTLNKGADGTPLPDNSGPTDFINDDKNIVLTLDSRLQKVTFDALSKQVKEWEAKKGFAMVMDVNNGEILSLASSPSFDPNKFWEYDPKSYKNWYALDLFEPGSTFKPINLALALEEEAIEKDGIVNDDGKIKVGGWTLSNWNKQGNGYIDYPKVLQVSSNVAMVKIMQNMPPSKYWDWLVKLGINKKIDTDLFESTPGYLKTKDVFVSQPIEQAVASFGQGFSISQLKLAQLHAALANGGYEIIPHVTLDFNKEINSNNKSRYFSRDVSKTVSSWMESVVDEGSGIDAKIDGYRIGGKTGTSQKAVNGNYGDEKICSFVATLPIDNPKFMVLVVLDEPSKAGAYGSTVAVPVAKEIIESLIVIEKVPPSTQGNKIIVKKT